MRITIPLLPILVDIHWRPLPPPRFGLRSMMIAVGVTGLVFSIGAYTGRLVAIGNEHAYKYVYSPPGLESDWHALMAQRYHHAAWNFGAAFFVCLLALVAFGMAAAFGRLSYWLHLRSAARPGKTTTQRAC